MSQDYHHHHHHHHPGLFSFGFERSQGENLQQIRREKFQPPPVAAEAAAAIQEEEQADGLVGNNNETSGMLSEMFNFNFHHSTPNSTLQGFHGIPNEGGHFSQFTWPGNDGGLSLSLSSSLHHLDAAKPVEAFRLAGGDGSGMIFFGQGVGPSPSSSEYPCKNNLNLISGMDPDPTHHIHVGFGSSIGLRNSKYAKAAQELLEDFCSVVRGQTRQFTKNNNKSGSLNPNSNPTTTSDGGDGGDATNNSPSSSTPPLSAAERIEHQRRKVKLLSMLDEVDRRYNKYCEQMQMVVNSFDLVMGFGAAGPYTVLAQKAMSRHFRCLKEAVAVQLKHSCEMLGEKDGCALGLTKGETPRLKMLEQSLRQQRAFHHQIGMMEPEAWRPQRGLPEKSVNALRAWLFEHFLHPYPSDADKHMLARQTGLSRSQVSNWFINARVRLWKPMVEEMYQQEVKVDDSTEHNNTTAHSPTPNSPTTTTATTSPPLSATADTVAAIATINAATESDPSLLSINANVTLPDDTDAHHYFTTTLHGGGADTCHRRFGTNAAGNVSLTLGLRHAGNLPDKNNFFG